METKAYCPQIESLFLGCSYTEKHPIYVCISGVISFLSEAAQWLLRREIYKISVELQKQKQTSETQAKTRPNGVISGDGDEVVVNFGLG